MTKTILILAITAVLFAGTISVDSVFAAKDDTTKLQEECAKEPKDPLKIKPDCELLDMINDIEPDPQADSFFDVFFDVFTVDSFFDIMVDIQSHLTNDGDLDATNELQNWSNLPGIPTELLDGDADTTYSGADFATSDQSCPPGQKVIGIDASGIVTCDVDIDTDTNSNAQTLCVSGQYLDGDGNCDTGFLDSDGVDSVDDADNDPTNELQTLSLSGTQLSLNPNGGSVTLPTSGSSQQLVKTVRNLGDPTISCYYDPDPEGSEFPICEVSCLSDEIAIVGNNRAPIPFIQGGIRYIGDSNTYIDGVNPPFGDLSALSPDALEVVCLSIP